MVPWAAVGRLGADPVGEGVWVWVWVLGAEELAGMEAVEEGRSVPGPVGEAVWVLEVEEPVNKEVAEEGRLVLGPVGEVV